MGPNDRRTSLRWAKAFGCFLLVAAVTQLSLARCFAEIIVDNSLGFTLKLPDGFMANADIAARNVDIAHAFVLGDPTDDQLDLILFVENMRGTIGSERLKQEDMPPEFRGRLFTTKWQGFTVDGLAIPEQLGEQPTITYNVQIPLKKTAIQVKLFGPTNRQSEMRTLLAAALRGLEGESNWKKAAATPVPETASQPTAIPTAPLRKPTAPAPSAAEPSRPAPSDSVTTVPPAPPATSAALATTDTYGMILLGVYAGIVLGGLVVLWLISRVSPRGTVLAIAVGLYVIGAALAATSVREIVGLAGALKMLGFAGGILGIADLIRKRHAGKQSGPPPIFPTK